MTLQKIVFSKDYRCFSEGDSFEFSSGLTTIVGDNGSGKSTLISAIRGLHKNAWSFSSLPDTDVLKNNSIDEECLYIDLGMDMMKNKTHIDDDFLMVHLQLNQTSMGQAALIQLTGMLESPQGEKAKLIIIDEPERGLSHKSQILIAEILKRYVEKHSEKQIILVTHSEIIMKKMYTIGDFKVMPKFTDTTPSLYIEACESFGYSLLDKL